jgi:D-amino peptidase
MESGEGEMNAAFAGAHGVPVLLAAGDSVFVAQFSRNVRTTTVSTKVAVTPQAARLKSPDVVRRELAAGVGRALETRSNAQPLRMSEPVRVRIRFDDTTRPQILEAIPGVKRSDGYTVDFTMPTMKEAYRMIRFMYRFVAA